MHNDSSGVISCAFSLHCSSECLTLVGVCVRVRIVALQCTVSQQRAIIRFQRRTPSLSADPSSCFTFSNASPPPPCIHFSSESSKLYMPFPGTVTSKEYSTVTDVNGMFASVGKCVYTLSDWSSVIRTCRYNKSPGLLLRSLSKSCHIPHQVCLMYPLSLWFTFLSISDSINCNQKSLKSLKVFGPTSHKSCWELCKVHCLQCPVIFVVIIIGVIINSGKAACMIVIW